MKHYYTWNAVGFGICAAVVTALVVYVVTQAVRIDGFGWAMVAFMSVTSVFLWAGAIMHGHHAVMVCKYGESWLYGEHESQRREAGR